MKEFSYEIKDEIGIHARPAGLLVRTANNFSSDIKLKVGEKTADAKKIFSVMSLGAKKGDTVMASVSGADEEAASKAIEEFFFENL